MKTNDNAPEGPAHVNRLNSITKLKAEGFEGPDVSLCESIFEYGIAWKVIAGEDGPEVLFIHRASHGKAFDRTTFAADTNVMKEFDWIKPEDWKSLCEPMGTVAWLALPLWVKINDLVNHYGSEEIFGTTYWEGFQITDGE